MRKAQLLWSSALALALGTSGCGMQGEPCAGDACPEVEGIYTLQSSLVTGQCGFVPLLPGPSLFIDQVGDGSQVVATFIDPVNQLEVELSGDLLVSADSPETASFVMIARFPRVMSTANPTTVDMTVTFSGTIALGERRQLSATLTNQAFQLNRPGPNPDNSSFNPGQNTPSAGIGGATPTPIDTSAPTGTFDTSAGIGGQTAFGATATNAGGGTTTGPSSCTTTVTINALGERR